MNNDIMRHILEAAAHLNNGDLEDTKEALRDAIERIDIQVFNIEEED